MKNPDSYSIISQAREKLAFVRGSAMLVLAWPLLCLVLGGILWASVGSKVQADREAVERNALKDAGSLARAYAEQLGRMVDQVDQISLLVRYEWEKSPKSLQLEQLLAQGMFPSWQYTLVTIIDRDGKAVTGTLPVEGAPNFADRDYFRFHRDNMSSALRVGAPIMGRLARKPVITMTRRLNKPDGAFNGIVLISVAPAYFMAFYDGTNIGPQGMLAMVGKDGAPRVFGVGGVSNGGGDRLWHVPPLEALQGGGGSVRSDEWFADRRMRFVGWEPLSRYPLVAIVGLSAEDRLAPYQKAAASYRNIALAGSAALLLFAMAATWLALRLAWRKHQEEEVQDAYRIASEGGTDGFYMLRALRDRAGTVVDFEVVDCNARGASFYGLTREQFIGRRSSILNTPEHFRVLWHTYCDAMRAGFYEDELEVPSGSPIRVKWVHRRLVRSGTGLAITFRDISQAKAHERELWMMANHDALTGLPNRNWLISFLPGELHKARDERRMLALLFIDLDDFKNVNDSLGHSTGDELLRAAAQRLQSLLRPRDHVVRLGGDEFTVILEQVAGEADAAQVAERMLAAFDQPFDLPRGCHAVNASIGISLFPRDGGDTEELLKNSDIAMYHAKWQGKGNYHFYTPGLSARLKTRLDTEKALQEALALDQFVLFYQPRVAAANGELRGMEALVRWVHPTRGLVPPLDFIPLAEETGLILKLGELVVEKACAQLAQWKSLGLPLVPVSINVSPYQFHHGDIRGLFTACLARHRIDPSLVEIEITESSMMGDQADIAAELAAIRAHGIKLLVDDFGTGYSSLSLLQQLDMDVLKVDRAFTSSLGISSEGEVFFRAIVSMAHALGMQVVAEGVETAEQLRMLQALSCDEIQGYFISRPVPANEARMLLERRSLLPLPALRRAPLA